MDETSDIAPGKTVQLPPKKKRKRLKLERRKSKKNYTKIEQKQKPVQTSANRPQRNVKKITYKEVDEEIIAQALGGENLYMEKHIIRRNAIGYFFMYRYAATPDRNQWFQIGKHIKDSLNIPQGNDLNPIFDRIRHCIDNKIKWSAESSFKYSAINRNYKIQIPSKQATIIAQSVQKGSGRLNAQIIANMYQESQGLEALTESAVYSCILRMHPVPIPISLRPQGSKDTINSPGALARLYFSLHTILRLQIPSAEGLLADFMKEKGLQEIPSCFKFKEEEFVHMHEIIQFDEVHRECCEGSDDCESIPIVNNKDYVLAFPMNKNGDVDLENGEYSAKCCAPVDVKFPSEARMCFGFAIVIDENGKKKGVRCNLFDYTKQKILTIPRYKEEQKKMIDHVKKLPVGGEWIKQVEGTANKLYADDVISSKHITGLGKKTAKEHLNPNGISTIKDLLTLSADEITTLCEKINQPRITITSLTGWKHLAEAKVSRDENENPMNRPEKIDYRKANNPFQARYGDDWEKHLAKYKSMAHYRSIKDLVWHMVHECIRLDKRFFWHDALTQLTNTCTREWMKQTFTKFRQGEQSLYDFWLRPRKDLYQDVPEVGTHYDERNPGNLAVGNCCDEKLNKAPHESVNRHVILTFDLPKDHPSKFSRSTPEKTARAYKILMDPDTGVVPTSDNIIKDFEAVFTKGLPNIVKSRGLLTGSQHDGKRYQKKAEFSSNWGGRRVRKLGEKEYNSLKIHPLALDGIKVKIEKATTSSVPVPSTFAQVQDFHVPEVEELDSDPVDEDQTLEVVMEEE